MFQSNPGQLSPVIRTAFGYHIARVDRVQAAQVQARHILVTPRVTEANVSAARALADSVARLARAGASLDSLARLYHDPGEQSFAQGAVLDSVPAAFRDPFAAAQRGQIIGPITMEREGGASRFSVVRLEELRPAGSYTFEELKDRIRNQLAEEAALRRYLDGLRKRTYIDIRL